MNDLVALGVIVVGGASARLSREVLRRRIGEDEVRPDTLVEMLGAPQPSGAEVRDQPPEPGVAVGQVRSPLGGDLIFVEAARMLRGGG